MRTNKKALNKQRQVLDQKIVPWLNVRDDKSPPTGWIKATRLALGLSIRQLAKRVGMSHASLNELEKREAQGKATIELMDRVTAGMGCHIVYAVVPNNPTQSLEAIVDSQAKAVARNLVAHVDQSMRLESQGVSSADTDEQTNELAEKLKSKLDSRLWDKNMKIKRRKSK